MKPIVVSDPADPRIEMFRDIRERDVVGRGGFIAEGAVVLDQLLRSTRFRPTALLILKSRLAGVAGRLGALGDDIPVYVAESAVFDRVAGFAVHRGIMAHAERTPFEPTLDLPALARANATVVAGVGIGNHDNLGAIFRNAAAFGAAAVLLDRTACDPLYRKAIRVSVGATLTVPFERGGTAEELVEALGGAGFACVGLSPRAVRSLQDWRPRGPVALFLGAEGEGLAPAIRSRIEGLGIDMAQGFDSLNVATAGAIALHHVFLSRAAPD